MEYTEWQYTKDTDWLNVTTNAANTSPVKLGTSFVQWRLTAKLCLWVIYSRYIPATENTEICVSVKNARNNAYRILQQYSNDTESHTGNCNVSVSFALINNLHHFFRAWNKSLCCTLKWNADILNEKSLIKVLIQNTATSTTLQPIHLFTTFYYTII